MLEDPTTQNKEYQEATQERLQKMAEDVPFYERANIRPRELAALRNELASLQHRIIAAECAHESANHLLVQAEGERDAYEDMVQTLLAGLGFDAENYDISLSGMREAIATLLEIIAGKCHRKDYGNLAANTVIGALFGLLEQEKKGRVYPLRRERKDRK